MSDDLSLSIAWVFYMCNGLYMQIKPLRTQFSFTLLLMLVDVHGKQEYKRNSIEVIM